MGYSIGNAIRRRPWRLIITLLRVFSQAPIDGFVDCTGSAVGDGISRAWRRAMLEGAHPDKGGDNDLATAVNSAREHLRDPLRLQIERILRSSSSNDPNPSGIERISPFGSQIETDRAVIRSAYAWVEQADGWPHLRLEVNMKLPEALSTGSTWNLALGARGHGTIHYHGDVSDGGYDVCCDFIVNSSCVRTASPTTCDSSSPADGCISEATRPVSKDWQRYESHDCPLAREFKAAIRKPLHKNEFGQWGAAVQVRNEMGADLACLAVSFPSPVVDRLDTDITQEKSDKKTRASAAETNFGEGYSQTQQFQFLHHGKFCADGADILEGKVDDYGVGSRDGLYGGGCREKCQKRPRCRFYTAYSSGWCELSTRCSDGQPAGDPLTVTYVRVSN